MWLVRIVQFVSVVVHLDGIGVLVAWGGGGGGGGEERGG